MKTLELQNDIIRQILNIKDNQLLEYLKTVILENEDKSLYHLNNFEKQILQESLSDYKQGKVVSNEDVFSKTDKWSEKQSGQKEPSIFLMKFLRFIFDAMKLKLIVEN